MDRGDWWAKVRGVAELDMTERLTTSDGTSKNLLAKAGDIKDAGSIPG